MRRMDLTQELLLRMTPMRKYGIIIRKRQG